MRPELEVRWWPRRPRRRWRRKEVTVGRGRKRAPSGAWEKMNPPAPDNSIQHDRITFTPPPPPPCINPRQVMKSLHFLIVVAFPPLYLPLPPSLFFSLLSNEVPGVFPFEWGEETVVIYLFHYRFDVTFLSGYVIIYFFLCVCVPSFSFVSLPSSFTLLNSGIKTS